MQDYWKEWPLEKWRKRVEYKEMTLLPLQMTPCHEPPQGSLPVQDVTPLPHACCSLAIASTAKATATSIAHLNQLIFVTLQHTHKLSTNPSKHCLPHMLCLPSLGSVCAAAGTQGEFKHTTASATHSQRLMDRSAISPKRTNIARRITFLLLLVCRNSPHSQTLWQNALKVR